MSLPDPLLRLIEELQRLPGIGPKGAQRLAFYLLRTPHRLTGPHDVSRYFSTRAECFHLKEWTYGELADALRAAGYGRIRAYWYGKGRMLRVPLAAFRAIEAIFARSPRRLRQRLLPVLLPSIVLAAVK